MLAEVPSQSPESDNLWEQGVVPYILKNDLDDEEMVVIQEAFAMIARRTPCINFT